MRARRSVHLLVAAVVAAILTACAPATQSRDTSTAATSPPAPAVTAVPAETAGAVTSLVIVGDSNTTGFTGTLDAGLAAGTAWAAQLPADRFPIDGGWGVYCESTAAMRDGITAASVSGGDRVLVMGGTNDLSRGIDTETILGNVRAIVAASGAPAATVLAIAPSEGRPGATDDLNAELEALAAGEGWNFIDPWTDVRTTDGRWSEGYLTDGVHTTPEGYARAGQAILAHLEGGVQ